MSAFSIFVLIGWFIAFFCSLLIGWAICTGTVALIAVIKGEDVEEAISPWLAEL